MFGNILPHMLEQDLTKIAYIVFFVGITFLYFYSQEFEVQPIPTIEGHPRSEIVRMQGVISQLTTKDNVIFAQIDGQRLEKTDVIIFTGDALFLKVGQNVDVEGTVEDYKGKKEIIAQKILVK